jgi:hypothetical protein
LLDPMLPAQPARRPMAIVVQTAEVDIRIR